MPSENLAKLVKGATLAEIAVLELRAKKAESADGEKIPKQVKVKPNYTLETAVKEDNLGFLIAITTDIDLPSGSIYCQIGATYKVKGEEGLSLQSEDLLEYANEVGVMTLLPFIRQNVADLSQRVLGFPLLMPIMPRGALYFSKGEEIQSEADDSQPNKV